MKRSLFPILGPAFFVLLPATGAMGAPVANTATGLVSPDVYIGFNESTAETLAADLALVGVTLSPNFLFQSFCTTVNNNGACLNSASPSINPGAYSISFGTRVREAGFFLTTQPGTTTFSALLDGVLVESYSAPTNRSVPLSNFYGFQAIEFDEIRFSISAANFSFNLDQLQFSTVTPVPGPASALLLMSGLVGLGLARTRTRRGRSSAALTR